MRPFAELRPPANSLPGLYHLLQTAIELEHSTIPAYLYALYSIKPGTNQQAAKQIRSVVMEEMLHMTLAANVLNAIGGHPAVGHRDFMPEYPTYLPQSNEAFVVNLARFSPETIRMFMRIELPCKPTAPPKGDDYNTIGQFYEAVEESLKTVCKGNKNFIKDHSHQVTPEYFYNSGGNVMPVTNLEQALEALDVIVDQGEGVDYTIYDGDHRIFGQDAEYAHYFRYKEIHDGRYYAPHDTPKRGPTGAPMAVDWSAVYPARTNPKAADYPVGSELREMCDNFNLTYQRLLAAIHAGFNGQQKQLIEAVQIMYEVKYQAVALMQVPAGNGSSETAGPSFEWIKDPKEADEPAPGPQTIAWT
jgi:hypothetical protein